jgi:hypothetical protein
MPAGGLQSLNLSLIRSTLDVGWFVGGDVARLDEQQGCASKLEAPALESPQHEFLAAHLGNDSGLGKRDWTKEANEGANPDATFIVLGLRYTAR